MYKYMLEKLSAVNDIYDAPGNHLICLEEEGNRQIYRITGVCKQA